MLAVALRAMAGALFRLSPMWPGPALPAGATGFQVGQSDVSAEAVAQVGDSVFVTAPIPPGQKQIVFTHVLPAAQELRLPLGAATGRVLVLLEDTAPTLVPGPPTRRGVETFEDAHFALFDGTVPSGGAVAVFRFTPPGHDMTTVVVIALVVLVAAILGLTLPLLWRRRTTAPVPVGPETAESLARQIAVLDRAFGTDLPKDVRSFGVAKAVAQLAADLGITVVAEGVETAAQFQVLQRLGVDSYQGWLFSRAVGEHEFRALLAERGIEAMLLADGVEVDDGGAVAAEALLDRGVWTLVVADERYEEAAQPARDIEEEASAFAAALLMPQWLFVREHARTNGYVATLGRVFGTSETATQRRVDALFG